VRLKPGMGNRVYRLQARHEGRTREISLSPDCSVWQLKERIAAEFGLPAEQQLLQCGGRALQVADTATVKQARLASGSRITVSRQRPDPSLDRDPLPPDPPATDPTLSSLANWEAQAGEVEAVQAGLEEERRGLRTRSPPLFSATDPAAEHKRLKLETRKCGEQLMQLLESVDQVDCAAGRPEHRARRKEVATKLNSILDKNDKLLEKLSSSIRECQNSC